MSTLEQELAQSDGAVPRATQAESGPRGPEASADPGSAKRGSDSAEPEQRQSASREGAREMEGATSAEAVAEPPAGKTAVALDAAEVTEAQEVMADEAPEMGPDEPSQIAQEELPDMTGQELPEEPLDPVVAPEVEGEEGQVEQNPDASAQSAAGTAAGLSERQLQIQLLEQAGTVLELGEAEQRLGKASWVALDLEPVECPTDGPVRWGAVALPIDFTANTDTGQADPHTLLVDWGSMLRGVAAYKTTEGDGEHTHRVVLAEEPLSALLQGTSLLVRSGSQEGVRCGHSHVLRLHACRSNLTE